MSNYLIKARHKDTGHIQTVRVIGNMLGPRKYGYIVGPHKLYTQKNFNLDFEILEDME